MFSGSVLVTLCLFGMVMAASLNGSAVDNSSDEVHDHEHDSHTKIFLSLLLNGTSSNSNSTDAKNSTSSQLKVRDVDDVKSLNETSDAFNSTSSNSTDQMRRRQIDDLKTLNATDDSVNSTRKANETIQQIRRAAIPTTKPSEMEDLDDDAVNATEKAKARDHGEEEEDDDVIEDGPEGIVNSTTTHPERRDLDDVILNALNTTEEDDEADNSTNKASSRIEERAVTLNASLESFNETRLNSSDMVSNMTVRAAGNETEVNGTTTNSTTTTASPWSILPFFRDLTKAKEEINEDEAVNDIKARSVFIVETLNDDLEDDASLDAEPDAEPSEEDRSIGNSTTTADPQDES